MFLFSYQNVRPNQCVEPTAGCAFRFCIESLAGGGATAHRRHNHTVYLSFSFAFMLGRLSDWSCRLCLGLPHEASFVFYL